MDYEVHGGNPEPGPEAAAAAKGAAKARTGIVMLNLGAPQTLDDVGPFLREVLSDGEIVQLPFQGLLGPFIANRRTKRVRERYERIGGGSPLLHWTRVQGQGMVERLDRLSPETAPHRFYVAFRYTEPTCADALMRMQADGVGRAVAFTQYPQFSCATTGAGLNELWRAACRMEVSPSFRWSVIDRWPTHPGFVHAMAGKVEEGLARFPEGERDDVLLLFSAHSLPLSIIDRGDPYPQEVGASVHEVMNAGSFPNRFILAYQSQVGPIRWQGASTDSVIRELGAKGTRNVLVVGIAFTSDHIETMSEIDIEYAHLARKVGIRRFERAPSLNGDPAFQDALADIVRRHLASGEPCTGQYGLRCPGCTNPECRYIPNPVAPYDRTPLRA